MATETKEEETNPEVDLFDEVWKNITSVNETNVNDTDVKQNQTIQLNGAIITTNLQEHRLSVSFNPINVSKYDLQIYLNHSFVDISVNESDVSLQNYHSNSIPRDYTVFNPEMGVKRDEGW